jgi:hypothetical protein
MAQVLYDPTRISEMLLHATVMAVAKSETIQKTFNANTAKKAKDANFSICFAQFAHFALFALSLAARLEICQ